MKARLGWLGHKATLENLHKVIGYCSSDTYNSTTPYDFEQISKIGLIAYPSLHMYSFWKILMQYHYQGRTQVSVFFKKLINVLLLTRNLFNIFVYALFYSHFDNTSLDMKHFIINQWLLWRIFPNVLFATQFANFSHLSWRNTEKDSSDFLDN